MMKRISLLMILALALPALAAAEDWSNVSMIDTKCSAKVKADPDSHTRACAMSCAKSGFGILDKDGNYLKFDDKGNQEAIKLLQNTDKKDHLRVNVSGKKEGDIIQVESLKMKM
jgi:hypothetical protein